MTSLNKAPPEPEQGTIVVKQETATPHKDKPEEGTPTKDSARGSPQAPRIRMKVSPKAVAKAKAKARAKAQSQPAEGHYEAPDREAWKDVRYQLQKLEKAGVCTKLAQCCADCGEPAQGMVPLGIHGDGVPVLQGRMNQSSLDFITVNLLASRH